jgi:[ribosomal protein S5]-alanine N-acetyltransferase
MERTFLRTEVLKTERLKLYKLTSKDAPFILELLNTPGFLMNIGDRGVRDEDGAIKYIVNGPVASYQANKYGLYLVKFGEESVGICGLVCRDFLPHPDIGFAFLPAYFRMGFAYEAARGVLNFARETLKLQRVLGITKLDNEASMGVLRKLGLKEEGIVTNPHNGEESRLFAIDL